MLTTVYYTRVLSKVNYCDKIRSVARRVYTHDLIDAQCVADLLGLAQRTAVSVYQKRYADMPRPVVNLGGGRTLLWIRQDMEAWAQRTGRLR